MIYKPADTGDIEAVLALLRKYHSDMIAEGGRADGFVTTQLNRELAAELIEKERGLFIARDGEALAGFCMSASWEYCSKWPMFQKMIEDLGSISFSGETLSVENSYQYGPICIEKEYRGKGVLQGLFGYALGQMESRYPYMVTFVNTANPRSVRAHQDKLKLTKVKEFSFNGNSYIELACKTSKPGGA